MGLLNSKSITGYLGGYIKFENCAHGLNEVSFGVRVDRTFYAQDIKPRSSVSHSSVSSVLQHSPRNQKKNEKTTLTVLDLEAANAQANANLNLERNSFTNLNAS